MITLRDPDDISTLEAIVNRNGMTKTRSALNEIGLNLTVRAYVDELETNGVFSASHLTLRKANLVYGEEHVYPAVQAEFIRRKEERDNETS